MRLFYLLPSILKSLWGETSSPAWEAQGQRRPAPDLLLSQPPLQGVEVELLTGLLGRCQVWQREGSRTFPSPVCVSCLSHRKDAPVMCGVQPPSDAFSYTYRLQL